MGQSTFVWKIETDSQNIVTPNLPGQSGLSFVSKNLSPPSLCPCSLICPVHSSAHVHFPTILLLFTRTPPWKLGAVASIDIFFSLLSLFHGQGWSGSADPRKRHFDVRHHEAEDMKKEMDEIRQRKDEEHQQINSGVSRSQRLRRRIRMYRYYNIRYISYWSESLVARLALSWYPC